MIALEGLKIGPIGLDPTPQGLDIGEKLLWKYEETRYATKPTIPKEPNGSRYILFVNNLYAATLSLYCEK